MNSKKMPVEAVVQLLMIWYAKHVKRFKQLAKEIGYKIPIYRPGKKLHLLYETMILYMFIANVATNFRFDDDHETGQEIIGKFTIECTKALPPDDFDDFMDKYEIRIDQYVDVVDLEGGTMFASAFMGNVFGEPMKGMSFKAIPLQIKLLSSLSTLSEILSKIELLK